MSIRAALVAILAALLLAAAGGVVPAAPAAAPTPKTTLPDVEDEVMCTQCGTPLNVSEAVVADRQRRFIQAQIDLGRDKDQIKAALEAEYGPRVLAVPSRGGFDDVAYVVPIALGLLGILGVAIAARRWRRARGPDPDGRTAGPVLAPEDTRRLDAELKAFDA